jgi:hypothetical protein
VYLFIIYPKRRIVMSQILSLFIALIFLIFIEIPFIVLATIWELLQLISIKLFMFISTKINDIKARIKKGPRR